MANMKRLHELMMGMEWNKKNEHSLPPAWTCPIKKVCISVLDNF